MGSLMRGWNSPVLDHKSVQRNRSHTKEETEAYWRSKRKVEEEHLRAISMPADDRDPVGTEYKRSASLPAEEDQVLAESDLERKNLEKRKKNIWWTKSDSAFLNKPRVLDGVAKDDYASRYGVADVVSFNLNHSYGAGAWLH